MAERFEDRLRAQLRTHAGQVRPPSDPEGDVRRRVRRQDVVTRSVSGLLAVVAIALVVGVGLPRLAGGLIVFDQEPADGGGAGDPAQSGEADDLDDPAEPEGAGDPDATGEPDDPDPSGDPDVPDPGEERGQSDPEEGPPSPSDCSAARHGPGPPPQDDLPPPVADTRAHILEAASACDYDELAAIAAASESFTYSFGGGDDPAAHWRRAEAEGKEVLWILVELLERPYATVEGSDPVVYAWPPAFVREDWDDVTAEERDALRGIYDDEDFEEFAWFGGYFGYRVGIDADGQWKYFVAGD